MPVPTFAAVSRWAFQASGIHLTLAIAAFVLFVVVSSIEEAQHQPLDEHDHYESITSGYLWILVASSYLGLAAVTTLCVAVGMWGWSVAAKMHRRVARD